MRHPAQSGLKAILSAAAASACLLASTTASAAGLLGTTVSAGVYYPTFGNLYEDGGPVVVGAGVEYEKGVLKEAPNFFIDIADDQLIIGSFESTYYVETAFNGFGFTFGSVVPTGATVDAASGYAPVSMDWVGSTLLLNFIGIEFSQETAPVFINLTFGDAPPPIPGTGVVPEPATWALLILGFAATGGVLRGRRRAEETAGAGA